VFLNILTVFITLLYPLAIWFGEGYIEPRWLSGVLLMAVLLRIPLLKVHKAGKWLMFGALILMALAVFSNALLPLKLYPVLVNAGMLAVFGYSLVYPPSIVERIARIKEPDLPVQAIMYTRRVTQVWCIFFVLNGSVALITSVWASHAIWSLYNGVIAYVLMGVLFSAEYLFRLRFKRRHNV